MKCWLLKLTSESFQDQKLQGADCSYSLRWNFNQLQLQVFRYWGNCFPVCVLVLATTLQDCSVWLLPFSWRRLGFMQKMSSGASNENWGSCVSVEGKLQCTLLSWSAAVYKVLNIGTRPSKGDGLFPPLDVAWWLCIQLAFKCSHQLRSFILLNQGEHP